MLILIARHKKVIIEKYIYQIKNMTSRRQKYLFHHFCLRSVCLDFFENFFMYARPISVQTKVHFKNLQFLAVTYDMGVLSFAFDVV